MGVYDRSTGRYRLRAIEPRLHSAGAERFNALFGALNVWVQKGSRLVVDNSIDKEKLR